MMIDGVEIIASGFRINDSPTDAELKKCIRLVRKNKKHDGNVEKIVVKQDGYGKDTAYYYLDGSKHSMSLKKWRRIK